MRDVSLGLLFNFQGYTEYHYLAGDLYDEFPSRGDSISFFSSLKYTLLKAHKNEKKKSGREDRYPPFRCLGHKSQSLIFSSSRSMMKHMSSHDYDHFFSHVRSHVYVP